MSYVVVDIETRIDKALVNACLYASRGAKLSDDDAFTDYTAELAARDPNGSAFPAVPFHIPISIAVGNVASDHRLLEIKTVRGSEEDMVRSFWTAAEGFRGALVTFNGRGFDLPVLELQALRYGIPLPNYLGPKYGARYRFQTDAHLDLFEFVGNYGAVRLRGGLDVLSRLIGAEAKGEVRGGQVQELYDQGRLEEIHAYCREDVGRTYRLLLAVQVMRGMLAPERARELTAALAEAA